MSVRIYVDDSQRKHFFEETVTILLMVGIPKKLENRNFYFFENQKQSFLGAEKGLAVQMPSTQNCTLQVRTNRNVVSICNNI